MIQKTKAVVLSSIKYGDNSIILKCFTENSGYKSFFLKSAFSKKNKKYHFLLPLNEIEISFYEKNNSLELIKDIFSTSKFNTLYSSVVKSSIITFLVEVLNQILKKEENNELLYYFITENLLLLEQKENNFSDFHLVFLLNLTSFLGFSPLKENTESSYFNIEEGIFTNVIPKLTSIPNARIWNNLFDYDFSSGLCCFSNEERKLMLNEMIQYYELHLSGFKKPISLDILKVIF